MKDYNPANVFIICATAVLITVFIMIGLAEIEGAKNKPCTDLTAQVNEVQRTQGDLGKEVQSNRNANEEFDRQLKEAGYDGYYIYKLEEEDSYGIDDIPTIPLRGE